MNASATPTISIVLPIFREGPRLRRLLDAILQQTWPKTDMEIIVADGGSGDESESICAEYALTHPVRFLLVPVRGRAQGLNYAIRHARGQFIVRADGRSQVPTDYVARLYAVAQETKALVVGGIQRAAAPHGSVWQRATAVAMNSVCGAGPANHRVGVNSGPNDNVYLGLYRRSLFDTIGYFDEESAVISEEVDLHHRIMKAGGIVWLMADMIIPYEPRSRLTDQIRLYYRYGGAKAAFIIKYGELITLRQLVAPGFWATILALCLLGIAWPLLFFLAGGLLAIYALAVLTCSFFASIRSGEWWLFPLASLVAAGMHLGYALGYGKKLLIKDPKGHFWGG